MSSDSNAPELFLLAHNNHVHHAEIAESSSDDLDINIRAGSAHRYMPIVNGAKWLLIKSDNFALINNL